MATNSVTAVLFAKDLRRMAAFYREVFRAPMLRGDADHELLDCFGFHLTVHQIPEAFSRSIEITTPPERRERTSLRLNFPVDDIHAARRDAERLGGQIDDRPPPWVDGDGSFFLGYDPEGNVIGVTAANAP
jgi:predicted enzyme related to lactoylglutathione lyase